MWADVPLDNTPSQPVIYLVAAASPAVNESALPSSNPAAPNAVRSLPESTNSTQPALRLTPNAPATTGANYKLGACIALVRTDSKQVGLDGDAGYYLRKFVSKDSAQYFLNTRNDRSKINATIVKTPESGSFKRANDHTKGSSVFDYIYKPVPGMTGRDSVVVEITDGVSTVQIYYNFVVVEEESDLLEKGDMGTPRDQNPELCPKGEYWKMSSALNGFESDLAFGNSYLIGLINNATQAFIGFSDLSGITVGEATGIGSNAKITLDTNAAGYGWFIDSSPQNNDEFLPTADANIWKAKAGSAAEGKMDMISVLLHEYGHSLGLKHSTAASDAMAATLKSVSAAYLLRMSWLNRIA